MKKPKNRKGKHKTAGIERLLELLDSAIMGSRDFILTFETDEDTGEQRMYIMIGKFISPCMLRKLIGQAESQRDEGSTLLNRTCP